jgi:hypothetical protein
VGNWSEAGGLFRVWLSRARWGSWMSHSADAAVRVAVGLSTPLLPLELAILYGMRGRWVAYALTYSAPLFFYESMGRTYANHLLLVHGVH